MGFSILARNGLCSLMICWLLLVPAGVLLLVSLLLSSFFLQERGSVPWWFAGSSWFWLGFRCLSPFSFFFLSSGKGFCFIMICWFLLLLAGVPVLVSLLPSFFPQDRGSVPSWFAGSSWFRLGFRCLSPFFSLLSFIRKGVLFHDDLLVPLGSGWGSGACLPSSPFFLSSGKVFCFIMICWFLLVLAGVPVLLSLLLSSLVPVLVSLHLSSFFPQERESVPSWCAGSSWFRLGFRCLSPFFSLLSFSGKGSVPSWFAGSSCFRLGFRCLSPFFSLASFLRKGVLFHDDLLVPLGSGWGSGACLPSSLFFGSGACLTSSLFFRFSEKRFCSIMICWFFLVPAGVPVLVSLLLFSFLRKGVLFHHDLLVPPGSGWGSGACLPFFLFFGSGACIPSSLFCLSSGKGFCSMMICWYLLVLAGCLPSSLLLGSGPVLVSLLLPSFFPQERGSVPSWFAGSSGFRLGFRCLSPFFSLLSFLTKGVLFHDDLLVPLGSGWGSGACLPSSLLFGSGACLPSSLVFPGLLFHHDFLVLPGSGWGSGACLPSSLFFLSSGKGFCSIMICWFFLVPAGVPVLVSLLLSSFFPHERGSVPWWFAGSSWFWLGFRCLSPFFSLLSFLTKGVLFHHDLLVPLAPGWGSGACLPSSLFFGSGACLPSSPFFLSSGQGFCSIMICWFLLVPAGVLVLVSLLLSSFFPQERGSVPSWFAGSSCSRLGFRCLSPFFSFLSFLRKGVLFHHDVLVPLGFGWGSGASLPSSLFFGSGACLPSSLFFLSSGKGVCSIMICWFLLVPAGVRCLSPFFSLLWFRCLSPFFSLLSFLRKWILFHHDLSNRQPDRSLHILIDLFHRSCVSLVGSHMGLCCRYCSQETTALVWKLRTSTLCGFLDASGRLFYCLVFVRLK